MEFLFYEQFLQTVAKLMTECWASHPGMRLKSLRVQKTLNKLKKSMDCHEHQECPHSSVVTI